MRTTRRVWWTAAAVVLAASLAAPAVGWSAGSSLTLYGGIFGNDEYVNVWEGVGLSFGVHERVSLLARITGVHVIESDKFRDGSSGIGEGGVAFHISPNTSIGVLGGSYFGEIYDPIIDGYFSTAQLLGGHWFYLHVGGLYGFESERWQNSIYVSTPITDPAKDFMLFVGAESLIYNEGQLREDDDFVDNPDSDDVRVQAGPVLGLHKRSWNAGARFGVGGGDYGIYGTMSLYKTFSF